METASLLLLFLLPFSDAVYKQWLPNTNFENASNWNEQRIPCSQDKVIFESSKKVSVYVQSAHSLSELNMPWDGEFILASGAGFSASAKEDPACGIGSDIYFHDTDQYQWFDPTLWQSALAFDNLESGKLLFSVDVERVPCHHDDVIFSPETSFRVNSKATGSTTRLRSISVLGKRFTSDEEFSQHLQSNTGKLQFPGHPPLQITNTGCQDKTGCECGNTGMLQEICSALLRHTENRCPETTCEKPLNPAGHCCGICGAIITLEHTSDFTLDDYRNRLIHTFLSLEQYSGVKLAISKVLKPQKVLLKNPSDHTEIQIVIVENKESNAADLANDIMDDIKKNGRLFGILKGTLITSTGSITGGQVQNLAGTVSGIVIGVLAICLSLLGVLYFLYKRGTVRLPFFPQPFQNEPELETESDSARGGFENPIYHAIEEGGPGTPGLYSGEDALKGIALKQTEIQYSNPLYDEGQCDI
ncbi:protein amnionless [Spea bombifrons]|uniref:protein amnionless n=1 Tax=Spea bombifrons TaxID=233779 RepID=UPI00234AF74F|nr:protein amnionless [Spea bombifrons]